MLKQLQNLWRLSKMEQKTTIDKKVVLEAPVKEKKPKHQRAIVVELDKPDMFPKEETIDF